MVARARAHSKIVVGLMSGTSGDGVDAALVRINGAREDLTVRPLAFRRVAYPSWLQRRVLVAGTQASVSEVCRLNALLGEAFARAALRVIADGGLRAEQVDLIGSHGQTVHHLPIPVAERGFGRIRSTLQIAEPSIIAERTGVTTVADFRPRDMAAGGEGAPLAPYAHYVLFRHPRRSRLIVNVGGIANVTYVPGGKGLEEVRAFDTGPANMLLDGLVQRLSRGRQSMDRDGRLAATGTVDQSLLDQLLAHPFLRRRPPKSTGREEFGEPLVTEILRVARRRTLEDLLATCSTFTARTISEARRWLAGPVDEVIVGGGGVRNRTMMRDLSAAFAPVPIRRFEDHGWQSKAFEAIAFAVLAYQTMAGRASNVPGVTGASHPVLLGKIIPGRAWPTF